MKTQVHLICSLSILVMANFAYLAPMEGKTVKVYNPIDQNNELLTKHIEKLRDWKGACETDLRSIIDKTFTRRDFYVEGKLYQQSKNSSNHSLDDFSIVSAKGLSNIELKKLKRIVTTVDRFRTKPPICPKELFIAIKVENNHATKVRVSTTPPKMTKGARLMSCEDLPIRTRSEW